MWFFCIYPQEFVDVDEAPMNGLNIGPFIIAGLSDIFFGFRPLLKRAPPPTG